MKKLRDAKYRATGDEDGIDDASLMPGVPHHARPSQPSRTLRSSLTFGPCWSRRSFQTPLPGPSRLPHGACLAWKPVFPGGAWGPGSALRCLHVCRGWHLGQEVGKFGCGAGKQRHVMKAGSRTEHRKLTLRMSVPRRHKKRETTAIRATAAAQLRTRLQPSTCTCRPGSPAAADGAEGDRHCLWSQTAWAGLPVQPLPAVWPGTSHLTSLSPRFLFCKMEAMK